MVSMNCTPGTVLKIYISFYQTQLGWNTPIGIDKNWSMKSPNRMSVEPKKSL